MTLDFIYPDAPIGAECRGVNLAEIGHDDFTALSKLFDERSVLCIRDQNLSESAYIKFAKRFGAVEQLYMSDYAHPEYPEILIVSNIKKGGKDIGHADAGRVWHTDMSFMEKPPRATMLHARELPVRDGVTLGDTHFSSMTAAYEALTDTQRKRLEGLQVVHDVFGRRKKTQTHTHQDNLRKKQPKAIHPFVRTHPRTGRKGLYVSPGECIAIPGLPDAEALKLIDEMAALIPQERFHFTHKWRMGDVLIWDNCAVQHLASFDYIWPEERRLMWRITVDPIAPD